MDSKISPITSAFVCFLIFNSFVSLAQSVNNKTSTSFEPLAELKRLSLTIDYMKKVSKPVVKTIQSVDGDLIDCVPSHQQAVFDHPPSKGQKSKDPKSGKFCPKNTVPIRRTTEEVPVTTPYEAFVATTVPGGCYGLAVFMDVWAPTVIFKEIEYSSSHITLISGKNVTKVGWHVYPLLNKKRDYPDHPTLFVHLSTYYPNLGRVDCYNLACTEFVQTSTNVTVLGSEFAPVSSLTNGTHKAISINVTRKESNGNYTLFVQGHEIGYWSSSFFANEPIGSFRLGGEVGYAKGNDPGHMTQMGSGRFANEWSAGKAACFQRIKIYKKDFVPADKNELMWSPYADNETCKYSVSDDVVNDETLGVNFCFGGPGGCNSIP